MAQQNKPELHSFAVYPHQEGAGQFEAFILDVPVISHVGRPSGAAHDAAARRAWWSAFHLLGPRGIEPEDFAVYEWDGQQDGRLVSSGGIEQPEYETPWAGGWPA